MQRLEVLGYWFLPDAPNEMPLPQKLVGSWKAAERAAVLAYLRAGTSLVEYPDASFCRFDCGEEAMGTHDLTDGRWVWPEGLAHYVERHDVRLPEAFVAHAVACKGSIAPFQAPKPRFGLYDKQPWLAWAQQQGACLDLAGFEVPDEETAARIEADLPGVEFEHVLLCNGATREVVLDVGEGGIELRVVKAGGPAPVRYASWMEWPVLGDGKRAKGSAPSPAQRFPDRKKPGMSFDEFFLGRKKPDAES